MPRQGHTLQISPNLEALLEHDELTRRNSSSPTSAHRTATPPEFPVSLPPPPPRTAKSRNQREQGSISATRSKEVQRTRWTSADLWPDALMLPTDATAAQSAVSSRPVTPNPYLNPAPVLNPPEEHAPPHSAVDQTATPKQREVSLPTDSLPAADTRDTPHCPPRLDSTLWMGRDSLHLFSGSASVLRRQDPDCCSRDAVQDGQMDHPSVTCLTRPPATLADNHTATVSSTVGTSYPLHPPSSTHSVSDPTTLIPSSSAPHRLSRPSLPSISMTRNSSPRLSSVDSLTGRDYLSFIDFLSPPMFDEPSSCRVQDHRNMSTSRPQPQSITIPPSSLYSASRHNLSSSSLASMRFAPPSPTSLVLPQLSPMSAYSNTSSTSATLSSMMFAPPSPSVGHNPPTRLQPLSGPSSPYSPLEFARPPSSLQESIPNTPLLPKVPELFIERGRRLKSKKRAVSLSPHAVHHPRSPLPPTTNQLCASERADRIRRNRKLARVFGRVPGTEELVAEPDEARTSKKLHSPSLAALLMKQKSHRHAVSVSTSLRPPGMKTEPSTPWQADDLCSSGGRRHSIPLAVGSCKVYVDNEEDTVSAKGAFHSCDLDSLDVASTRSFIDLSDEDVSDDDVLSLSCLTSHQNSKRRLHQSNSTPSLVESFDSEAQLEAEKRQKREKVVKLHRFLGSCVPPEAVHESVFGPPLPPPAIHEECRRESWRRGNKDAPRDEFDRCKEELDEREKALNVRRAQKMERVFGTPPPQTLFHTRPSRPTAPVSQPTSPVQSNPYVLTLDIPPCPRNPNRSAYVGKAIHRQGPTDSSRCLLPHKEDTSQSSPSSFARSFADPFPETLSGFQDVLARSSVYLNYQHSLNSLVDIIDRDDRKSLVELHHFLHEEVDESPSEEEIRVIPRRASNATSFKSERRHSLPSNASMTSLSSEFHSSTIASQFQIRRRKAAKLTNFFGVDYRELIHDILESIEKGVEEERRQGTLRPQEVEALMYRVRSLRTLQDPFHC